MLHSHEAQQLSSTYMHQWVISPANDNDAEQTISILFFGIDLNK